MNKYINDEGKVGVLISTDFGAGWSTWCSDENGMSEFMLMDKTLVQMCIDGATEEEVGEYLKSVSSEYAYLGGWKNCKVFFIDIGTRFTVNEYDGRESLVTVIDMPFTA